MYSANNNLEMENKNRKIRTGKEVQLNSVHGTGDVYLLTGYTCSARSAQRCVCSKKKKEGKIFFWDLVLCLIVEAIRKH